MFEKTDKIEPIFFNNKNAIIFSTDANYLPYLAVTLESLKRCSNKNQYYDIIVLEQDLEDYSKKILINDYAQDNISIRFYNMDNFINDKNEFYLCDHFSTAVYYRIFIQGVLGDFDKAFYCDCDAIFMDDISKLYDINLKNSLLAAVHDTEVIKSLTSSVDTELKYFNEYLGLKNSMNYFQSGFLIFNLPEVKLFDLTKHCLAALKKINAPKFVDQDILNVVAEGKIKFLDLRWNIENHIIVFNKDLEKILPQDELSNYLEALRNPAFLHFSSFKKPWQFPYIENAYLWWKLARKTSFYEEIIYKNNQQIMTAQSLSPAINTQLMRDALHYTQNKLKYWRYKLLSKITFGKNRKKYKQKRKDLKSRLKQVNRFLKGK